MAKFKIAIVISTNRRDPLQPQAGGRRWDSSAQRNDIETEIVDLRDYPMPFYDQVASNAWVPSPKPVAQRWQDRRSRQFDGFIFVTAEHNRSIPAVLKNAIDCAYRGHGARSPPACRLRLVGGAARSSSCAWFWPSCKWRPSAPVSIFRAPTSWRCAKEGKELKDISYLQTGVKDLLDQLVWCDEGAQDRA